VDFPAFWRHAPFVYFFEMRPRTNGLRPPILQFWLCKLLSTPFCSCIPSPSGMGFKLRLGLGLGWSKVGAWCLNTCGRTSPQDRINCVWWSKVISTALNYYYLQEVSHARQSSKILGQHCGEKGKGEWVPMNTGHCSTGCFHKGYFEFV